MSMYESASRINKEVKEFFDSPIQQLNDNQKEFIINLMIQLGQVAKFRCRSNAAYDNFIRSCFDGIADCKRVVRNDGDEWATLRAFIIRKELIGGTDGEAVQEMINDSKLKEMGMVEVKEYSTLKEADEISEEDLKATARVYDRYCKGLTKEQRFVEDRFNEGRSKF